MRPGYPSGEEEMSIPNAPADPAPGESDLVVQRFRDWLAEHVWAEDDMGGFLQPFASPDFERATMANVRALFDLLDPDWRSYTWSGRRPDPEGG